MYVLFGKRLTDRTEPGMTWQSAVFAFDAATDPPSVGRIGPPNSGPSAKSALRMAARPGPNLGR